MEIDKIKRVVSGRASPEEREEVEAWASGSRERGRFLENAGAFYRGDLFEEECLPDRLGRIWGEIKPPRKRRRVPMIRWIAVAACVAVVSGVFFFLKVSRDDAAGLPPEVMAHSAGVRLSLPDGRVHEITPGSSLTSEIPGFQINGTGGIQQLPIPEDSVAGAVVEYNEIVVPRGGEYLLTLADGTSVMLNSETRMKFPVFFTGAQREVFLEGEAYFDVTRDERKPFFVHVEGASIRVLGTQFNVMAYEGMNAFTTLISGRVEVASQADTLILNPGQQCEWDRSSRSLSLREADLLSVLAWKNGEFVFKDVTLEYVMNELARWYDAEIVYDAEELKTMRLHVYMNRTKTLEEMLQKIVMIGNLTYEINGRKVVLKKQ